MSKALKKGMVMGFIQGEALGLTSLYNPGEGGKYFCPKDCNSAINSSAISSTKHSFYLPVTLALHYLQRASEVNLKQAEKILLVMGEYFQIQDDYLDVFKVSEVTGKVDMDNQHSKCTWIIVQGLQRCTGGQRQVLFSSYGQKGDTREARVKRVFWPDRHGRGIPAVRRYEDQRAPGREWLH